MKVLNSAEVWWSNYSVDKPNKTIPAEKFSLYEHQRETTFEIDWSLEQGYHGQVELTGKFNYCLIGENYYFLEPIKGFGSDLFLYLVVYDFWSNEILNKQVSVKGILSSTSDLEEAVRHLETTTPLTDNPNEQRYLPCIEEKVPQIEIKTKLTSYVNTEHFVNKFPKNYIEELIKSSQRLKSQSNFEKDVFPLIAFTKRVHNWQYNLIHIFDSWVRNNRENLKISEISFTGQQKLRHLVDSIPDFVKGRKFYSVFVDTKPIWGNVKNERLHLKQLDFTGYQGIKVPDWGDNRHNFVFRRRAIELPGCSLRGDQLEGFVIRKAEHLQTVKGKIWNGERIGTIKDPSKILDGREVRVSGNIQIVCGADREGRSKVCEIYLNQGDVIISLEMEEIYKAGSKVKLGGTPKAEKDPMVDCISSNAAIDKWMEKNFHQRADALLYYKSLNDPIPWLGYLKVREIFCNLDGCRFLDWPLYIAVIKPVNVRKTISILSKEPTGIHPDQERYKKDFVDSVANFIASAVAADMKRHLLVIELKCSFPENFQRIPESYRKFRNQDSHSAWYKFDHVCDSAGCKRGVGDVYSYNSWHNEGKDGWDKQKEKMIMFSELFKLWIEDWDNSGQYSKVYWGSHGDLWEGDFSPRVNRQSAWTNFSLFKNYKGQWYQFELQFTRPRDKTDNIQIWIGHIYVNTGTFKGWNFQSNRQEYGGSVDYIPLVGRGQTSPPWNAQANSAFRALDESLINATLRYMWVIGKIQENEVERHLFREQVISPIGKGYGDYKEFEIPEMNLDDLYSYQHPLWRYWKQKEPSDFNGLIWPMKMVELPTDHLPITSVKSDLKLEDLDLSNVSGGNEEWWEPSFLEEGKDIIFQIVGVNDKLLAIKKQGGEIRYELILTEGQGSITPAIRNTLSVLATTEVTDPIQVLNQVNTLVCYGQRFPLKTRFRLDKTTKQISLFSVSEIETKEVKLDPLKSHLRLEFKTDEDYIDTIVTYSLEVSEIAKVEPKLLDYEKYLLSLKEQQRQVQMSYQMFEHEKFKYFQDWNIERESLDDMRSKMYIRHRSQDWGLATNLLGNFVGSFRWERYLLDTAKHLNAYAQQVANRPLEFRELRRAERQHFNELTRSVVDYDIKGKDLMAKEELLRKASKLEIAQFSKGVKIFQGNDDVITKSFYSLIFPELQETDRNIFIIQQFPVGPVLERLRRHYETYGCELLVPDFFWSISKQPLGFVKFLSLKWIDTESWVVKRELEKMFCQGVRIREDSISY